MKWLKWLAIGFFSLILVIFIVTSSTFDLVIHHERYGEVIERARELTAKTTETVYFRGDWDFDISPVSRPSNVCAQRGQDGTLFVRILVRDLHRLGKLGLVYTENDSASARGIESALDGYGCGEWSSKGRIWGHWWAIENNLG